LEFGFVADNIVIYYGGGGAIWGVLWAFAARGDFEF
jgi:hypothetical protein